MHWLEKKLPLLTYYHPKIISRNNYGWCEFIDHLPCQNEYEVELFYTRMGSLLAVTHLLCSSDFHIENLIAHGAYPYLVDLECILTIPPPHSNLDDVNRHSVLSTYILPTRILHNESYNGIDISAISGDEGEENPYKQMRWEKAGTDEMHLVREPTVSKKSQNKPFLNSHEKINPAKYETCIVNGFKETFLCIQNSKEQLLSPKSPLEEFKESQIRTVLRATATYGKLLYESYHPLFLNDKHKRSEHFAWLEKHLTSIMADSYDQKKIVNAELLDMEEDNIPYFYCYSNDKHLFSSKHQIVGSLKFSCFDYIQQHLKQYFNERDLEIQLILIENAYTGLKLTQEKASKKSANRRIYSLRDYEIAYSSQKIQKTALNIAKEKLDFLEQYVLKHSGRVYWPFLELVGKNAWTASAVKFDLYHGLPGIMLAFAYGSKIFHNESYAGLFTECRNTIFHHIKNELKIFKQYNSGAKHKNLPQFLQNLGFYSGCGGLLYSLGIVERLFPHADTTNVLEELLISAEKCIQFDEQLDIISGCAGFILGLTSIVFSHMVNKYSPIFS